MHSKRQQVLDKLAERCLTELSHGSTNIDLVRLYLEYSKEETAAGAIVVKPAISVEDEGMRFYGAKGVEEIVASAIKHKWEDFELRSAARILYEMRKAEKGNTPDRQIGGG